MTVSNPFTPRFEDLPGAGIPIFPLPGAIVLPGCDLHLNIFEPRYLNMINDSLSGHRLIAMAQPNDALDQEADVGAKTVFPVACAGRITTYQETNDGRLLIVLTGVCRLRIVDETLTDNGYRQVTADWSEFRSDMESANDSIDVSGMMSAVETFLGEDEFQANVESLKKLPPEILVNTMAMHMPFNPVDKQALIEAVDVEARAKLLAALCQLSSGDDDASTLRH